MILRIEVENEGKVDYASLRQTEGAEAKTLTLKGLVGIQVEVLIQPDLNKEPSEDGWVAFPNPDRSPFIISEDGAYGLVPSNNLIQLFVPDGTNVDGITAVLS
jgi:hypothetical protein